MDSFKLSKNLFAAKIGSANLAKNGEESLHRRISNEENNFGSSKFNDEQCSLNMNIFWFANMFLKTISKLKKI